MRPDLQYLLEHFGVAVAAMTGVLAARGKRIDLFGVSVLALVTAFGGGTVRDAMLGALPVFWVSDSNYVFTALATALAVFFLRRGAVLPDSVLLVADAFALALFAVVGMDKAMRLGAGVGIGVVMGVITGVAGGILRDVLLGQIPIVFRAETYLYATAAFLGCLVHAGCSLTALPPRSRLVVGVSSILILRLAGIRWQLSLPVFVETDEDPGHGSSARPPH